MRRRMRNRKHLPGRHAQADHAGVDLPDLDDDDSDYTPGITVAETAKVTSKHWDSYHLAALNDRDGDYGPEGGRLVAMDQSGYRPNWRSDRPEDEVELLVPAATASKFADALDELMAEAAPLHGKADTSWEEGPQTVGSRTVDGYHIAAFHDLAGDRRNEGDVWVSVATNKGAEIDWDDSGFDVAPEDASEVIAVIRRLSGEAGQKSYRRRRHLAARTKRNYVRDGDGQFAETPGGGGSNALDKLNLAGKVPPGVTVRASRKVRTDNQDLLIAEVDTPEGPRTRIGVVNPEDSKKWGGGYHDPAKQQRIDEIREELADLDEAESEDDYDPELYEELSEELAELEDSESGNRTAEITPDQMSQLSAQLSEALEKAKANKVTQDKVSKEFDELEEREAELVAEYGDPQLEAERTRLQRQISNLRTRSAQTGGDFDRERAARDKTEFEAQLAEAQARLNHLDDTRTDGMPPEVQEEMLDIDLRRSALNNLPDIDDIIMRGGVDAADGSMLAFETWGSDVDSIGWSYTRVAIVPPGKTFDEVTDAEEYSGFDGPKGVEKLLKGLGADVGAKGRNGFMVKTGSGTMHQTKTQPRSRFTIKAADKGEFTAVVATLGQIDSDNDVTHKGAFDSSEFPLSAYGHTSWGGALPVGVARIKEVGNEAVLEGRFFLDTAHGRDTFTTVKHLGELGQWSYGYDAVEYEHGYHEGKSVRFLKKLKVHEASPVLVGAGVNTRTLSTKNRNSSFSGEAATVVTAVKALTDRAADVMAMRRQRGKGLGADSVRLLTQVTGELKRLQDILDAPASDADVLNAIWLSQVERAHR